MTNRLSHSQFRLYQECGHKYKLHYVDKLRERVRSGALIFGEAIDKTFEAILKDPSVDDKALFDKLFEVQEINKRKVHVPTSTLLVYSSSDYDGDLIQEEDIRYLEAKAKVLLPHEKGNWEETYKACASYKKQAKYRPFKDNERIYFNFANWLSLRRKGHVMLKSFRDKVLPNVVELVGTQVKIELTNDKGDSILGYADFVGKWKGTPDTVVLDFKTSSIEYEDDSVVVSPQLTLYAHALELKHAGYIVFSKRITKNRVKTCSECGYDGSGSRAQTCTNEASGKRCGKPWVETINPEAEVKFIISEIPEQTDKIVLENADVINNAIRQGIFVRNLNSCKGTFGLCGYYNLCYKGSKNGLETVE